MLVDALVAVGEQAVVAGPDAALPARPGSSALRSSPVSGSKCMISQRRPGRLRQRARVVDQAAEHARAAFGGLDEQRPAPAVRVGQLSLDSSLSSSWNAASMPRSRAIAAVTAVSGLTAAESRVTRMLRRSST